MLGGLLLVDKPAQLTSHDVVARVRRLAGTRRVGHAGTLDPMATGLLVLGIERCTKLLTYLVGADKTYAATIRLGQGTLTDDAEGEVTGAPGVAGIDEARIRAAVDTLTGEIAQVPSAVSAIKIGGRRSYARVRAGEEVELPARNVRVYELEVGAIRTSHAGDGTDVIDVDAVVRCSSGTYIRALARDLGSRLGSAGHLTSLRRTQVAPFDVDAAATLEDLAGGEVASVLIPAGVAMRTLFPDRHLSEAEARAIGYGQRIAPSGRSGVVAGFAPDGSAVALLQDAGEHARPLLVMAPR